MIHQLYVNNTLLCEDCRRISAQCAARRESRENLSKLDFFIIFLLEIYLVVIAVAAFAHTNDHFRLYLRSSVCDPPGENTISNRNIRLIEDAYAQALHLF